MNQEEGEKAQLSHDPVPGYRTAFFVALTVGVLYLGLILYKTLL
jgi:hypothetical protein